VRAIWSEESPGPAKQMNAIRILIVDVTRWSGRDCTACCWKQPGIAVVGEARNGREAVTKARELKPRRGDHGLHLCPS